LLILAFCDLRIILFLFVITDILSLFWGFIFIHRNHILLLNFSAFDYIFPVDDFK